MRRPAQRSLRETGMKGRNGDRDRGFMAGLTAQRGRVSRPENSSVEANQQVQTPPDGKNPLYRTRSGLITRIPAEIKRSGKPQPWLALMTTIHRAGNEVTAPGLLIEKASCQPAIHHRPDRFCLVRTGKARKSEKYSFNRFPEF